MHKKRITFKILIIPLVASAVLHILLAVVLPVGAALNVRLFREEVARRFDIIDVRHVPESQLTGQKTERLVTLDPAALAKAFSDITDNADLASAPPKVLAASPVAPNVADHQSRPTDTPVTARAIEDVLENSARTTQKLAAFNLQPAARIVPKKPEKPVFEQTFQQPLQPGEPMILQNASPTADGIVQPAGARAPEVVPSAALQMPVTHIDLNEEAPSPAFDDAATLPPPSETPLALNTTVSTFSKSGESGAFFRLMITADSDKSLRPLPKTVLFVVDLSQSMPQQAVIEARNAIARCLPCLEPDDRFNVLTFGTEIRQAFPECAPADSATLKTALDFIPTALEEAKTDAAQAVAKALDCAKDTQRPCVVFVVTNGATPRAAEAVKQDLATLANDLGDTSTISTFSAGDGSRFPLFEALATLGNGQAVSVPETKDSAKALVDLVTTYCKPLMTGVSCTLAIPEEEPPYPSVSRVYFAGRPIVVFGRTSAPAVAVQLTGKSAAGTGSFFKTIGLPSAEANNQYIAQAWAREKIRELLRKQVAAGDAAAVDQQIKQLSAKFAVPAPDLQW